MNIVKYDPWSRSLMRSLLDDELIPSDTDTGLTSYETENDFVVKANVAGVPANEVDISVERGVVTIQAEHEETQEEKKKKKVVYREGRATRYLYTTSIPTQVVANKAKAEIEDGIVTVTIPKSEESKPQKIKVQAKTAK
jgi:HSP20 family protein